MENVIDEVKNLIINARKSYYEYLKEEEIAATEREKNIAQIRVLSSALRARKEVAEIYTRHFFEERKMLREMADNVLNKAIEKGDFTLAQMTIEIIEFEYGKDLFGNLNRLI